MSFVHRLMSDVTLVVGDSEYPSHRLILCASSDVFQVMLMNQSWTESTEKRIVLGETQGKLDLFAMASRTSLARLPFYSRGLKGNVE